VFFTIGSILILLGLVPMIRFLVLYFTQPGRSNIQSLLLGAVLIIVGFQTLLIGLLADLIRFNRKILEEILYRIRRADVEKPPEDEV